MRPDGAACRACGAGPLRPLPGFAELARVTSDCRPWRPGGELFACGGCGAALKPADGAWAAEAAEILGAYALYHQAAGAEQPVFDPVGGTGEPRSEALLRGLRESFGVPDRGRMLDVGCGTGGLLRAFSRLFPGWRLEAADLDERSRTEVEAIAGVEAFHVGPLGPLPRRYDLITLVHVLEHVPEPVAFLERLRTALEPRGRLLVQVPDFARNPFDLIVADHCTHFTPKALGDVLHAAGFAVAAARWVPKELSALAWPASSAGRPPDASEERSRPAADPALAWLGEVAAGARRLRRGRPFGLFGTAIAATWLFLELEGAADFFVDEDPARIGRRHLGLPVLGAGEVPPGAHLYLGIAPELAKVIGARLRRSRPEVHLHLPPEAPPRAVMRRKRDVSKTKQLK